MTITSVVKGVTEVYNADAVTIRSSEQVICSLAEEIMNWAKEAQNNEPMRVMVHRMMRSACAEDVAFQIHNGDRVLMYTGGEHDKTDFLIALPGEAIELWSYGK